MSNPTDAFHQEMLQSLSFLKALMMITVVLSHACSIWAASDWFIAPVIECHALGFFADWLGLYDVPMFVFLSGYLYSYLKLETDRYNSIQTVIKKKIHRLLVPYVFICLFWAIPFWLLFFDGTEIVSKYFLGKSPSQLWFLLMLFWLFVIFELLFHLIGGQIRQGGCVPWLIVIALYLISFVFRRLPFGSCYQFANSMKYSPFFFAGFEFRRKAIRVPSITTCWFLSMLGFAVTILSMIAPFNIIPSLFRAVFLWLFERAAGVLMVVAAFALVNQTGYLPIVTRSIIWTHFENNSMGIYLFHQQLVWCVVAALNLDSIHPLFVALSAFLIPLLVSDLITVTMSKTAFGRSMLGC